MWPRVLQRVAAILREEGIKSVWFKILGATVYRRLLLLERPLDEPIPEVTARSSVVISLLTEAEITEYINFRPEADPSDIRSRLAAGQWCFVARYAGRIVHACWVATKRAWIDYLASEIRLAADEVYPYESFTAPDVRGQSIASVRSAQMLRYFHNAGYRRSLTAVLPENKPALRPLEKVGYRPFGVMGYIQIGPWRHDFCRVHGNSLPPGESAPVYGSQYWDQVLTETCRAAPTHAWRAYIQRVYRRLIRDWLPTTSSGGSLKTDLFEEAITPHHLLADLGPGSVGIDLSPAVVQAARERLTARGDHYLFVVGDLRRLPLRSGSITRIVSGSSLDHFPDKADIATSLAELARVLAPGGVVVITFDNPHHPVVRLRNCLPFAWLRRLRLVPFYVGATYNRVEARQQLAAVGLTVTHVTAVAHAPRPPAKWVATAVERLGWEPLAVLTARFLDSFEVLERWPTRYRTGYYLAVRAEKR